MTTNQPRTIRSLGSLRSMSSIRALASASRRGHLAGSAWRARTDRDLDRVSADLLWLAQADADERVADADVPAPVDLDARRARGARPSSRTAQHAHAS